MDWLNSFLGRKEEKDIKLEPDGVKEFENNEDIQSDIKEAVEVPKAEEPLVIEGINEPKPAKAAKARPKAKAKKRKKGRK